MRFSTLSECQLYVARYLQQSKAKAALLDNGDYWHQRIQPMLSPLKGQSLPPQRITGIELSELKGKPYNGKKCLQIVIERFDTGTYEVVCYIA